MRRTMVRLSTKIDRSEVLREIEVICKSQSNRDRKEILRELSQELSGLPKDEEHIHSCIMNIIECEPFTIHSAENLDVLFELFEVDVAFGKNNLLKIAVSKDSVEMVRCLLSWGANASKKYIKDTDLKQCNPSIKEMILKSRHLGIGRLEFDKFRLLYKKLCNYKLQNLLKIPYLTIGQTNSIYAIQESILTHVMHRGTHSNCLVIVLCGPPGNGKTHYAESLGQNLCNGNENFIKIPCEIMRTHNEVFGSSGNWQGASTGSELNNFFVKVQNHSFSVVLLDEFDKLEESAQEGFYNIFDRGIYKNKRASRRGQTCDVNCKNVMFLLTMNALDPYVAEYFNRNKCDDPKWLDPSKMTTQKLKKIVLESHRYLEDQCEHTFPDAMISRITLFVPFFPLEHECFLAAFISNYLQDLEKMYLEKYSMNIQFNMSEICEGIIEEKLKIKVNTLGLRYVVKTLQPYRAIAKDLYFYEHLDKSKGKMMIGRNKKSGEPFKYKQKDDEKNAS